MALYQRRRETATACRARELQEIISPRPPHLTGPLTSMSSGSCSEAAAGARPAGTGFARAVTEEVLGALALVNKWRRPYHDRLGGDG